MIKATSHGPADYRFRPEKKVINKEWLDKLWHRFKGLFESSSWRLTLRRKKFLKKVSVFAEECKELSDEVLIFRAHDLGESIKKLGFRDILVAEIFAIIRELSGRTLGMKHFNSQLTGGWIMLQGRIAEMKTGEGKTLTAVLPVITASLSGLPVHVITVNDYLTERDADEMSPLYEKLGLSVGVITHEKTPGERREAYLKNITYVTGKELVFDYLRDRMKLKQTHHLRMQVESLKDSKLEGKLQLRGLHFALVDEADSVLIDESRTPLIISGVQKNEDQDVFIETAFDVSKELKENEDFTIDRDKREINFTEGGRDNLKKLTSDFGPLWKGAIRREEIVHKALMSRNLYQLNKDYLVRDGKVELIDPLSGRVMEGRSWEGGLHQLIELKEGCELTQQRTTLAKISYQNFFRRYLMIGGMTGTALEVRKELWNVYGLAVSKVATHRPEKRKTYHHQVFKTEDERWTEVVKRCQEKIKQGQSILIGTDSVVSSELGSEYLNKAGIQHQILSAKQDKEEAEVVKTAGLPGRVTIATSMAGRGTDIKLDPIVKQGGGLHVIQTNHYESIRVDRQLAGRCARQGDPGSYEMILTLENQPIRTIQAKSLLMTINSIGLKSHTAQSIALKALRIEQQFVERQNYLARQATLEYDLKQSNLLAITGPID
ncbi:preprotein translocase subunit SecA [Thiomicrorhabdus sp. Milos-T2]|uniref:preprotein translocase subunit SecA n=1 Tax=Thiomicrorhabdus sp. Milos-T2 TaxID=90814 RepID=UPI000494BD10|nr:preprotein translocase subunit SecA [Thiomicrorhabdus sp. Milos-T2]